MTNNPLRFYKGRYGTGSSLNLPDNQSAIVFNEEEGLVYVNGKSYGGKLADASFNPNENVLTFTYNDGRDPLVIDFDDTASASQVLQFFENVNTIIGGDVDVTTLSSESDSDALKPNYSGTHYISEAESLVDADKTLDSTVYGLQNTIEGLDASDIKTVEISKVDDVITITNKGVSQLDGQISQGDVQGETFTFAKVATTGNAEDVSANYGNTVTDVQSVIDSLDERINEITETGSFETIVSDSALTTPEGIEWGNVEGILEASAETMHKIYLVPANTGDSDETDWYDEYISIKIADGSDADSEPDYFWTKIGTTKNDLVGYVKTINVNGVDYEVTSGTTNVKLIDVITAINGESTDLDNSDYINVKAITTLDSTNGTNVTTLHSTVKTQSIATATDENNGLVTALDVRETIEDLDASEEDSDGPVSISLSQVNGKVVSLGVDVTYSTVTYGDGGNSDATLSATDGILLGSDVSKFVDFTNTRIGEEVDKVYANNASILVSTDDSDNEKHISIGNSNGVVLGSDITELLKYVDTKETVIENSNGANDALSISQTTDLSGKQKYDINLVWSDFQETPSENTENNG